MLQPLQPDDPRTMGPYRLQARRGRGGMGVVYLAEDQARRPVALKTILAPYARDRRFRERFGDEVRAAQLVPRPFVARSWPGFWTPIPTVSLHGS